MRQKLIDYIVDLSTKLNDDDLSYLNFNLFSNDQLLEVYVDLRITEWRLSVDLDGQ